MAAEMLRGIINDSRKYKLLLRSFSSLVPYRYFDYIIDINFFLALEVTEIPG